MTVMRVLFESFENRMGQPTPERTKIPAASFLSSEQHGPLLNGLHGSLAITERLT
jgi:hypothetical protein